MRKYINNPLIVMPAPFSSPGFIQHLYAKPEQQPNPLNIDRTAKNKPAHR